MKVLLIDDHAVVRAGLRRMLAMIQGVEILEASSGREGVATARAHRVDLIVLDLNMPELGGVELVARLRQIGPVPLLVLSMHDEPIYVTRALKAGAQGYVSKSAKPEELMAAIRKVSEGGHYVESEIAQTLALQTAMPAGTLAQLAPRDLEIIRQMAAGRSLHEIADALGLGYKTIANNCGMIKTRLGVSRTADLLRLALKAGLV